MLTYFAFLEYLCKSRFRFLGLLAIDVVPAVEDDDDADNLHIDDGMTGRRLSARRATSLPPGTHFMFEAGFIQFIAACGVD